MLISIDRPTRVPMSVLREQPLIKLVCQCGRACWVSPNLITTYNEHDEFEISNLNRRMPLVDCFEVHFNIWLFFNGPSICYENGMVSVRTYWTTVDVLLNDPDFGNKVRHAISQAKLACRREAIDNITTSLFWLCAACVSVVMVVMAFWTAIRKLYECFTST